MLVSAREQAYDSRRLNEGQVMERQSIDDNVISLSQRHTERMLLSKSLQTEDPRLREDALCAQTDPEVFFPDKGGSTRDAKKVCGACMVRSACLAYALENEERFGIWGGLSERERRRLKRKPVRSADERQVS